MFYGFTDPADLSAAKVQNGSAGFAESEDPVFLFGLFLVKNLFTDQELSVRILADVKNLFYALIAQSVEHAAVNRGVTGSSPV